jgi:hypothetical protein
LRHCAEALDGRLKWVVMHSVSSPPFQNHALPVEPISRQEQ